LAKRGKRLALPSETGRHRKMAAFFMAGEDAVSALELSDNFAR